jgi:hypothetical protein
MRLCDFLRVPALFIMDQIFKISFGFENLDGIIINLNNTSKNGDFTQYYKLIFLFFTKIIVYCLSKYNIFSFKNIIKTSINLVLFY